MKNKKIIKFTLKAFYEHIDSKKFVYIVQIQNMKTPTNFNYIFKILEFYFYQKSQLAIL